MELREEKQMQSDCMVFRNPLANNSRLGWIAAIRFLSYPIIFKSVTDLLSGICIGSL